MNIQDLEPQEEPQETKNRIQRIIENGSEKFEVYLLRKDGTPISVEISATCHESGRKISCFCGDITDRKKAEVQSEDQLCLQ